MFDSPATALTIVRMGAGQTLRDRYGLGNYLRDVLLEAAEIYAEDNEAEQTRWQQKIERARYEVKLAQRHYDAVDPDNRLVTRELERRFEKALREQEIVESEAEQNLNALEEPLNVGEEEQLRSYARDVATLWEARTTRAQDRKRIARCLIESVVVTAPRESTKLKAEVNWKGGEVTTIEVPKGKSGCHRYASPLLPLGLGQAA